MLQYLSNPVKAGYLVVAAARMCFSFVMIMGDVAVVSVFMCIRFLEREKNETADHGHGSY